MPKDLLIKIQNLFQQKEFKKLNKLLTNEILVQQNIALSFAYKSRVTEDAMSAIGYAQKAIALNPKLEIAYLALGNSYYLFVANNLFYRGNDAERIIPLYINNVKEIKVTVPERKIHDPSSLLIYKDTSYVSTLKKNGNGDLFKICFYAVNYKKYFMIKLFDYAGYKKTFFLPQVLENKDIFITVNNKDFNNAQYGSKNNPVPVFKYRGVAPIQYAGYNYDITPDEFKYNVTQYLTYVLPKEEFKKRFDKK